MVKHLREHPEEKPDEVKALEAEGTAIPEFLFARDYIWKHLSVIDAFLVKDRTLDEDSRAVLAGWERCLKGQFVLLNHLKSGSVFLGTGGHSYLVKGLDESFDSLFFFFQAAVCCAGGPSSIP